MKFPYTLLRSLFLLFAFSGLLFLNACSRPVPSSNSKSSAASAAESSVLGTQWGEGVDSRVTHLQFSRINANPLEVSSLRYSAARAGGERIRELLIADGRVGLRVLKDNGSPWPISRVNGEPRLEGKNGERYILEYRNYSKTKTYEIVATVDGLDVLNGQPGSFENRGYVLAPGKSVQIKGFRKSRVEVAAFRFSDAADSYAANSAAGSPSNIGVIGTAVFELIAPVETETSSAASSCKQAPCAFPDAQNKNPQAYANPPEYDN